MGRKLYSIRQALLSTGTIACSLLLFGCVETGFFEKDLSGQQLVLLSPADSVQTVTVTQTFWWEEMNGATKYRIQIVSPDFNAPVQLYVDSTITAHQFIYILPPNQQYQWRVRAENNSSQSPFSTRTIFVNDTSDLSQQIIVLQSPADNVCLSSLSNINFQWQALPQATEYTFIIKQGTTIVHQETTTSTSRSITLTAEGDYTWMVRGENSTSVSPYAQRTFSADTTAPNTPLLSLPVQGDTVSSGGILFTWSRGTQSGCTITDKLYLYADSALTNQVDMITTTNMAYTYTTSLAAGIYYWRVQSTDAAGNTSNFSAKRKLVIQ